MSRAVPHQRPPETSSFLRSTIGYTVGPRPTSVGVPPPYEILAARLLTTHNLFFYHALMAGIRSALAEDCFPEFKRDFLGRYQEATAG